ncbi:hypothetical protein DFP72DRAFT_932328 [Ephemerocybe angulata]|uniref:F-box domain-containing protein n=1 Tax=Ephemerocybe angulata TaxID=980116 RepID=A0A8H6HCK5_9AGAR|nr:hypothetical protein DFP72DRAFT_932328 [Tulosesus angulatus]
MQYRTHKESHKQPSTPKTSEPKSKSTQHGFLLEIPSEILSAITQNLDPASLLALGGTHVDFSRHVEQDSTWRGAFEAHYGTDLLFRRAQPTWRREFSDRHKLILRFAYSRVPSTTHAPIPAPAISHIHLLSPGNGPVGLLSLSLTYGIIARSVPFTGRTLPGFLDASGSTVGRGVGNPNAEFTPNVSACAITSAGGTVRLIWGYRTGHIAFMLTNRTMENPRRPAVDFRVSQEDEMHRGTVSDIVWLNDQEGFAVSGASDGRVKLWDFTSSSSPDLLWTSPDDPMIAGDAHVKVAASRPLGLIVGVRRSGAVDIWHGFRFPASDAVLRTVVSPSDLLGRTKVNLSKSLALHIDPTTGSVLVAFHGDVCFYRIDNYRESAELPTVVSYGSPEGGAILSSLQPCFAAIQEGGDQSFIITGDKLGCVNAYEWTPKPTDTAIRPVRSFQASFPPSFSIARGPGLSKAHANSEQSKPESITALAWTPTILATGTSGGVVTVWDSLTFERIRIIVRPVGLRRTRRHGTLVPQAQGLTDEMDSETPSTAVKQILFCEDGDTLFVNVGGEVIAWRAGDTSGLSSLKLTGLSGGKAGSKGATASKSSRLAGTSGRWSEQLEMKQAISESHALFKSGDRDLDKAEAEERRQKKNAELAHKSQLKKLGLSEGEALEYALMLSREDATRPKFAGDRVASSSHREAPVVNADALTDEQVVTAIENGDFAADEPAIVTGAPSTSSTTNPGPRPVGPPLSLGNWDSETDFPSIGASSASSLAIIRTTSNASAANTNSPSPNRSGGLAGNESGELGTSPTHPASLVPRMGRRESVGSAVSSVSDLSSKSWGSGSSGGASASVWKGPLGSAVRTPPRPNASARVRNRGGAGASGGSGTARRSGGGLDDMDADLRFAIELSLAEARNRGAGV